MQLDISYSTIVPNNGSGAYVAVNSGIFEPSVGTTWPLSGPGDYAVPH
jgi:hypothetical protein